MNGATHLQPVFRFLDRQIHEYGDVLLALFVYIIVPVIAWLVGATRRAAGGQTRTHVSFGSKATDAAAARAAVIRWNFDAADDDTGPFGQ